MALGNRDSDDSDVKRGTPPGVRLIRRLRGKDPSFNTYKYSVLFMTFLAYACYHASRKPFSIVKSVLDDEGLDVMVVNRSHVALYLGSWQSGPNGSYRSHWYVDSGRRLHGSSRQSAKVSAASSYVKGWAPFDKKGGKGLLGDVDLAFLASYAIGMYFSGQLGDRLDLRYFLTGGMIGSGFFICLFGMGYWWNIHSIFYFLSVQVMAGFLQSTGWPSVVPIVGRWFGRSHRGLIMGVWNAHTSIGNIVGSLLAAGALEYGWGWSFLLPGLLQGAGGLLMFFFLVVEPSVVGMTVPDDEEEEEASSEEVVSNAGPDEIAEKYDVEAGSLKEAADFERNGNDTANTSADNAEASLLQNCHDEVEALGQHKHLAVGFIEAWKIPGVASFAFCLFFSKLVAYTFLNWLPFYITQTKIAGEALDDETAGFLSTLFDVGGVVGGILAGYLSDKLRARAVIASGFVFAAIPALFLYRTYGSVSLFANIVLMMIAGVFVNGPYALITTAVSADLGSHTSLKGNPRAMATVTAIIDGTGSVGAAIGPLLTGYISELGWDWVFLFLMAAALMAGLLLTQLVIAEVTTLVHKVYPVFRKDVVRTNNGAGSPTKAVLNR